MVDLDTRTVTDAVADALSGQILSGRWATGTLVSELAVKNEFGVSRPTARAAIERMVVNGLLKRDAYRSARVPVVDAELVEDVYLAREAIETTAARRAARDGDTVDAAISAAEAMGRLGDDCSVSEVVALDVAFHCAVVDAVNSARLSRMHAGLMGAMQLCMADVRIEELMSVQEIAQEHLQIADAIQRRDEMRALDATTRHLWHARDSLLSSFGLKEVPRD